WHAQSATHAGRARGHGWACCRTAAGSWGARCAAASSPHTTRAARHRSSPPAEGPPAAAGERWSERSGRREERRRGGAPGSGGERARWHPLDAPASVGRRGNERVFRLGRRSLARHRTTGAPHGEPVPTILPVAAL